MDLVEVSTNWLGNHYCRKRGSILKMLIGFSRSNGNISFIMSEFSLVCDEA